jgi:hypothetical protein
MTRDEIDQDHFAAKRLNDFAANYLVAAIIGTLNKNKGLHTGN